MGPLARNSMSLCLQSGLPEILCLILIKKNAGKIYENEVEVKKNPSIRARSSGDGG